MRALICEKGTFETKNGDVYYTLVLSTFNDYFKDYRIFSLRDAKTGLYLPKKFFIDKKLYSEVDTGNWYDFSFVVDNETGKTKLVSAKILN